ncbi:MAG: hypothetical protein Tp1111DCM1112741_36 [Prokaryotic dsDNA virus sp.]|nr:MAG: hypothetical protein Tp1111DCM1112741_36 [Prokaryotic dsDNA virus sp.]
MASYKGYKNKNTFDFILTIMNDQDDYTTAMDMVKDANGVISLTDTLRDWAIDMADDALSSYQYTHPFIKSVVNSAIAEVDFYEVAETLIADSKELKEV